MKREMENTPSPSSTTGMDDGAKCTGAAVYRQEDPPACQARCIDACAHAISSQPRKPHIGSRYDPVLSLMEMVQEECGLLHGLFIRSGFPT